MDESECTTRMEATKKSMWLISAEKLKQCKIIAVQENDETYRIVPSSKVNNNVSAYHYQRYQTVVQT